MTSSCPGSQQGGGAAVHPLSADHVGDRPPRGGEGEGEPGQEGGDAGESSGVAGVKVRLTENLRKVKKIFVLSRIPKIQSCYKFVGNFSLFLVRCPTHLLGQFPLILEQVHSSSQEKSKNVLSYR